MTAYHVALIGMESTGVYWKPVYYALEDAAECWLLIARHMHNLPGRKTDVADAAWITQLIQHGLVKPSFVPPKDIREVPGSVAARCACAELSRGRGPRCRPLTRQPSSGIKRKAGCHGLGVPGFGTAWSASRTAPAPWGAPFRAVAAGGGPIRSWRGRWATGPGRAACRGPGRGR
ncbi:transposase [Streptomyces sp. NPDC050625]|uniref:IS110 family transposase n=1 Tax=Streptomyces sp. NPDC050625 TaxID=3154629 RepID=UPI003413966F